MTFSFFYSVNIKNGTLKRLKYPCQKLYLPFPEFSGIFFLFFFFLISMEMSLNTLTDTLFISLNSFFSLLILHLAHSDR